MGDIRVGIVEEHEIVRYGLVACLAEDSRLEVCAANADALQSQEVDIAIVSSDAARGHRFSCPIVVCSDTARGPGTVAVGNDVVGVLYRGSLTVVAFTGASGAGAVASGGALTGAPSVSLSTTHDGSLVYAVGNDWDRRRSVPWRSQNTQGRNFRTFDLPQFATSGARGEVTS